MMKKRRGSPRSADAERRRRIKIELARRDMTISDLARVLNINRGNLSETACGRRRTKKIEEKIAAFFGMSRQELFPARTRGELEAMRRAEAGKGRTA
jgi:transcriptional regulator with XRE-family HTH domain